MASVQAGAGDCRGATGNLGPAAFGAGAGGRAPGTAATMVVGTGGGGAGALAIVGVGPAVVTRSVR